ncbi:MAG: TlpA family protein disulfide reductase [Crocinitomicaceae bacterium]|nr:TlpA family protein disulfide reductase [Crocinitomicaceae bacterium]
MKKIGLLIVALTFAIGIMAQDSGKDKKVPSVQLKNMKGELINTTELATDGPIIISFWATWCSPCKRELNTINEVYEDWQEEFGVKLVAVSIDDEKTKSQVPTYVNGKAWDYIVLMDPNSDFRRAMGVNNVPHTFLINKEGVIVYSHNNYTPGDEDLLYQELVKLKNN